MMNLCPEFPTTEQPFDYDLIIVGLGPAGSTFARLLPAHFSVAALDLKSDAPDGFQKPCGGLLAPDAQRALASLGLTLPKSLLVDPQIFSVHTIDLDSGLTRYYQRFYLNLDRHRFDRWLQSAIPSHVRIYEKARLVRITREKEGFLLEYSQNGKRAFLRSKMVVGADGAASAVRKGLFPQKKIRSYVAIQQWFEGSHSTPFYSCVFDSKNTDCYSWALSKDGKLIFGGAYPAKNCRARLEDQKERLRAHGFLLGEPLKTEACMVLRPASPAQFCTGEKGAFLIGEAAGFISPSSLEGISSAILSAKLLARILQSGCSHPEAAYHAASISLRRKLSGKLLKCPFMYHPLLRRFVMKSGISAIAVDGQPGKGKEHTK